MYEKEYAEIMPAKTHMLQRNVDAEMRQIEMAEESLEEFEVLRAVEEFEADELARKVAEREKELAKIRRQMAINALRREGEWLDDDVNDMGEKKRYGQRNPTTALLRLQRQRKEDSCPLRIAAGRDESGCPRF